MLEKHFKKLKNISILRDEQIKISQAIKNKIIV